MTFSPFVYVFFFNINIVCKKDKIWIKTHSAKRSCSMNFFCTRLICSCISAYIYDVYYFSNCCILLKIKTIVLIKNIILVKHKSEALHVLLTWLRIRKTVHDLRTWKCWHIYTLINLAKRYFYRILAHFMIDSYIIT